MLNVVWFRRLQKVQKYLDSNADDDDVLIIDEELSNSQKSQIKDRTTDIKFRTRTGIIRRSMKPVSRFPFFTRHSCTGRYCWGAY